MTFLAALDFTNLQNLIDHPLADLLVSLGALTMFLHSRRGDHAKVVTASGSNLIAIGWLALAATGGLLALGTYLLGTVGL
jgi:hypothetical protein